MSTYQPFPSDNGHSGYGWPVQRPVPTGNGKAGWLPDLGKGGLGIGVALMLGSVLFVAGDTWGTYKERGASMQAQLVKLEARVGKIEDQAADIKTMVQQIRDRPQWTMHVEGKR
jgi:hypothetical protein